MADAGDIAQLIRALCDADTAKRELAAASLFERGSTMVQPITQRWLSLPALANLLERDAAGSLQITVGVAVAPNIFERIRTANGSARLANVPPDQDAREFELEFPGGVRLDILTTREPDGEGAIAKYLQRFGEGIQQVEISVSDVDRATEVLRSQLAVQPIYPATRAGADGTSVNFFLFPGPDGKKVLVELVESSGKADKR